MEEGEFGVLSAGSEGESKVAVRHTVVAQTWRGRVDKIVFLLSISIINLFYINLHLLCT